ncbi:SART-1 protein [Glomus cerebriforme]|uniref:SART-1 protein n=1 Tax=Glomus cerebriforme TaxID=658196 RepID=A0A397TDJ5_9GLOM|nr:SART-1 protein [Glomus cerebriforme]
MQVAHDISEFQDGKERILVLKDSSILENEEEGDQLVSVQLEEQQKLKKNLENKKKKPIYTGYDDEEFNFGGGGISKKNILSHYDEEIDGDRRTGFRLGNDGTIQLNEDERRNEVAEKLKSRPISLSYDKMIEIKDYYTKEEAEITFKKSKTKKKKKVRKKVADEEDEQTVNGPNVMEIDNLPSVVTSNQVRRQNFDDISFVDDDDLQQALARARKMATKKVAKTNVEEIARILTETRNEPIEDDETPGEGLVISDTSEFVRSLTVAPTITQPVEAVQIPVQPSKPEPVEEEKEEGEADDVEMDEATEEEKQGGWKEAGNVEDSDMAHIQDEPKLTGVVEEEPLVSSGMAATLALLQQKGFSTKPNEEQLEKERIQRERQKWLAEQRKKDLERQNEREKEKQKAKEKGYRGGGRDSESSYRDREHLREMEARFKDYKPDINLEYVDEFGNQLTPKEAFRQLSHKFHGKSSGKAKTEKRLKKLEEERKLKAMSSVDTPLNMATALQERQKASGSAHVVLSVGNRAVVPPSMTLSNNGKHSGSSKASGITSISSPSIITVNGGLTGQSMNAPEREKVTFGLKRKAEQETEKPSKKSKDQ